MKALLCCVFLTGAALPAGAAFPGYLPRVGPSPLRFLLPAPVLAQAAMPSLVTQLPETAASPTNSLPPTATPPLPAPPAEALSVPLIPDAKTGENAAGSTPPTRLFPELVTQDVNPSLLLTPRSLIHYFLPAQNGSNSPALLIPIGFAPPLPQSTPSSSATYNSPAGPAPSSTSTEP